MVMWRKVPSRGHAGSKRPGSETGDRFGKKRLLAELCHAVLQIVQ
jgi:hypothetical protein